jgi:cell division protein FtsL
LCSIAFNNLTTASELLYDVERDIESLNYDLSSQQLEVDRLREAVTDEGRDKLQRIRQARDPRIFFDVVAI